MPIQPDTTPPETAPGPGASSTTRRGLLKAAGAAALAGAGGLAVAPAASAAAPATATAAAPDGRGIPVRRVSIQLYTLRDVLSADVDGTLGALRDIGYRNVETAGAPAGLTVAEFREALDDHGLTATSAHLGIPQPFDAAAWRQSLRDANTLGVTYVNHPFFGQDQGAPIRDAARYEAFAADLDEAGRLARNARLQLGYHNHHAEFARMDDGSGRTGMDILFERTDPLLVHFELDLFWCYRGAVDPVDVVRAHPGRIRQWHVKDLGPSGSFEDLGRGFIDFGRIFATSGRAGAVEFVVERDDAGTGSRRPEQALDSARVGFDFLRDFRF